VPNPPTSETPIASANSFRHNSRSMSTVTALTPFTPCLLDQPSFGPLMECFLAGVDIKGLTKAMDSATLSTFKYFSLYCYSQSKHNLSTISPSTQNPTDIRLNKSAQHTETQPKATTLRSSTRVTRPTQVLVHDEVMV